MITLPIACGITGDRLFEGGTLFPDLTIAGLGLSLGPELIQNGAFLTDTIWTKGVAWTILGGFAVHALDATSSSISQPITFTPGGAYLVTFTIATFVSGGLTPRFTGGTPRNGTLRSAVGTYSQIMLTNTGNTTFNIMASGGTDAATVTDVSMRAIL